MKYAMVTPADSKTQDYETDPDPGIRTTGTDLYIKILIALQRCTSNIWLLCILKKLKKSIKNFRFQSIKPQNYGLQHYILFLETCPENMGGGGISKLCCAVRPM